MEGPYRRRVALRGLTCTTRLTARCEASATSAVMPSSSRSSKPSRLLPNSAWRSDRRYVFFDDALAACGDTCAFAVTLTKIISSGCNMPWPRLCGRIDGAGSGDELPAPLGREPFLRAAGATTVFHSWGLTGFRISPRPAFRCRVTTRSVGEFLGLGGILARCRYGRVSWWRSRRGAEHERRGVADGSRCRAPVLAGPCLRRVKSDSDGGRRSAVCRCRLHRCRSRSFRSPGCR